MERSTAEAAERPGRRESEEDPGVAARRRSERREAGSPADLPPGTLAEVFFDALRRHDRPDAFLRRHAEGTWESSSHADFAERVRALSLGLRALGYERGDRFGILSHTRLEWALADWASITAGLVSVPVYPILPPDQIAYILEDAGVRATFVAGQEHLDKLLSARRDGALGDLERVIGFEPLESDDATLDVLTLDEVEERGRAADAETRERWEADAREAEPGDLATIIYTSGTTGKPKGVMLSHRNLHSNVVLSARRFPIEGGDRALAFLPLAHVLERTAEYVLFHAGVSIAYAESTDTVARDMVEIQPTLVIGVPRVFEKIHERVQSRAESGGALRRSLFRWAARVGERRADKELAGEDPGPWLAMRHAIADRLVFTKLRERTGGRVRSFVSGGGPLDPAIARFFFAAGLPVLEGYGLTETSPVVCLNPMSDPRLGTVGPPIEGCEVRIAEDGEILVRGPNVMEGYFRNEEATRETIDEDGWLRTGDIGELDVDGYLSITDRKKQIIVTAYGKNIAPQPVERQILRNRFVSQAVLIGDRRKFPIAIVVPAFDRLRSWASNEGIRAESDETLVEEERVRTHVEEEVLEAVEPFAHYEQPKRVLLVDEEWTVENGVLTPSQKVKRRVVTERYAEEIDRLYREAEEAQEAEEGRTGAA